MAVAKMKKLGQDDSDKRTMMDQAKDIGSAVGNTARTFLMPEAVPEDQRVYQDSAGPVPPTQTPQPPNAWYQSYGRYAAPRMMPLYDEGGDVAPNPIGMPQEAFDPSGANAVGQSAVDSAAGAAPESGLHKAEDAVARAGQAMDDPSQMPGQTANTRMYNVQGLDRNYMTPMYDDGGKIGPDLKKIPVKDMTSTLSNRVKQDMMSQPDQYPKSVTNTKYDSIDPEELDKYNQQHAAKPKPEGTPIYDDGGKVKPSREVHSGAGKVPGTEKTGLPSVPKPKDPVLEEYDRQEKEDDELAQNAANATIINNQTMQQLQQPTPMSMNPIYDDGGPVRMRPMDGGPVKDNPNDGHHQMAILEEGERVLTPEQNAQYEQEHGAPADFGGRVLQQPNPPVRPMMDTEVETEPVGGAKMDTSNPPAAEISPAPVRMFDEGGTIPKQEAPLIPIVEDPAMARSMSAQVAPQMQQQQPMPPQQPAQPAQPAPAAPAPAAGGTPQMQQPGAEAQPEHNAMAASGSATPLPNERENLEKERAALKQKMTDAALGTNNNGKFDHIAYGEAKMALADLNKMHPWGQPGNHEGIGGKIAHGLATAGEIASDVVLGPGVTAAIPGTKENLNLQSQQGAQQIQQGLGQQTQQADIELKQAQAKMAGMPKTLDDAITHAEYQVQHAATPEAKATAEQSLKGYLDQAKSIKQAAQDVKPQTLQQQIADLQQQQLATDDPAEKQRLEEQMVTLQNRANQSAKLTDRRRQVMAHAATMNLDATDPKQYDQAAQDLDKQTTARKAEGGMPIWKSKAAIQNDYATQRALLVQQNADANKFGEHAATEQTKADIELGTRIAPLQQIKELLRVADANTVASNIIPWMTTMGILKEGKINRLNQTELAQLSPAQGSLWRWANAHADKIAAGELPDSYKTDIGTVVDSMIKEARAVHGYTTEAIDKNLGTHGQGTEVQNKPKGGTTVTPKKTEPNTPATTTGGNTVGAAEWLRRKQQQQPK